MLSIISCNRDSNRIPPLKSNIANKVGVGYELIIIDNCSNELSIFQAYNKGVNLAKFEYILFIHDDVFIHTQDFGRILINLDVQNLGVLGIAGSKIKTEIASPWWISTNVFAEGGINYQYNLQHFKNSEIIKIHEGFNNENQLEKVVLVDGVLLFTTRENCVVNPFDETYNSFHFYDLDFSLSLHKSGKINYVTNSILIEHYSAGSLNKDWIKASFFYQKKWPQAFYDKENTPRNFEKLAYDTRLQILFENKFYFQTFRSLLKIKYVSTRILILIIKSLLRG
jgi:hypothetical protein